jgi:hypothetical protein
MPSPDPRLPAPWRTCLSDAAAVLHESRQQQCLRLSQGRQGQVRGQPPNYDVSLEAMCDFKSPRYPQSSL